MMRKFVATPTPTPHSAYAPTPPPLPRPVNQPQTAQEGHQEGNVLGVEKRVGIQPGMEDEEAEGQQGQPAAAEQPGGQPGRAPTAGQKAQVGEQMAAQVDGAAVGETQQPLNQHQRHFEDNTVVAVGEETGGAQGLGVAQRIGDCRLDNSALICLVPRHPVIVKDGHTHYGQDRQGQQNTVAGHEGHRRRGPAAHAPDDRGTAAGH